MMVYFENLKSCLGTATSFDATFENYKDRVFPELRKDVLGLASENISISELPTAVQKLLGTIFKDVTDSVSVREVLNKLGLEEFLMYIDNNSASDVLNWFKESEEGLLKKITFGTKKKVLISVLGNDDQKSLKALFDLLDKVKVS